MSDAGLKRPPGLFPWDIVAWAEETQGMGETLGLLFLLLTLGVHFSDLGAE